MAMRILRYRGNSYSSPAPLDEAPRPGARSYRWVSYDVKSNNVVPLNRPEVRTTEAKTTASTDPSA